MQHEHEVQAVDVVDRLNGYNERFQSVEVRVGSSLSFDEAQSCGIQSYEGEKSYRLVYFVKQCMQNVDKMYIQTFPFLRYFCSNLKGEFIIIQKLDDSEFLHVNHVTVYTTETTAGLY